MTLLSRSARREHPILDVVDPSAGAASSLFSRGSLLTSTSGHFPASAEGASGENVYQVLAYAHRFATDSAVLIYPHHAALDRLASSATS